MSHKINRGRGARTPIYGFGDRCSTIELFPFIWLVCHTQEIVYYRWDGMSTFFWLVFCLPLLLKKLDNRLPAGYNGMIMIFCDAEVSVAVSKRSDRIKQAIIFAVD